MQAQSVRASSYSPHLLGQVGETGVLLHAGRGLVLEPGLLICSGWDEYQYDLIISGIVLKFGLE